MPGLYSLHPGLGSASKVRKPAVTENAGPVKAAGSEQKGRDDRTVVVQAGKIPEQAPANARRGWFELRGPQAMQFHQQAPRAEPSNQVTGTLCLGEAMRAKPRGNGVDILKRMSSTDYSSSGSAHEINSVCLAEMVNEFLEEEAEFGPCGRARCNCKSGTCGDSSVTTDDEDWAPSLVGEQTEILRDLIACVSDYENTISTAVTSTVRALSGETDFVNGEKSSYRLVMSRLRAAGHNAAICKSRWEHTGGIPGGDYEYIDVVAEAFGAKGERLIVDLDFRTQFEIARPSQQYKAVLQVVPSIFVGKADRLLQILNILCDATKRSVKRKGMPLPPWRKLEYIKAKWFSLYKRTTNASSSTSSSSSSRDGDIGGLIFRGPGWDPRFTTEMEANFNNRAAAERRKVLRDSNGIHHAKAVATTASTTTMLPFKKQEAVEPEGVVRGARLMLQLAEKSKSDGAARIGTPARAAEPWEPPAVNSSIRSGKAARKGTSLLATAILIQGRGGARIRARDELREPVFGTGAALF